MAITTITNSMVSVNAIQGTLIADNAITAVHIASNAVASIQIAENNVTAREIAANTITVAQLADDCVESDKIADGVITTNHLNKAMISSQTEVAVATGDFILLGDTSDSNNLKKAPISSILAGTLTTAAQTNITRVGASLGIGLAPTHNFNLQAAGTVEARFQSTDNDCQLQISSDADEGKDSILNFLSGTSGRGSITYDHNTTAASQKMIFKVGDLGVTAMTILGDGKVGIGVTDPDSRLEIKSSGGGSESALKVTDASSNNVFIQQGGGRAIFHYGPVMIAAETDIMHANMDDLQVGNAVGNRGMTIASGNGSYGTLAFADGSSGNAAYRGFVEYFHNEDSMRLGSGGTERIRIESTGDVRFNIASAAITAGEVHTMTNAGRGNNLALYTTGADQYYSIDMWNHTGGSCNQVQFRGGAHGAVTGTITSTGNNATQYNTSSDYRLKENVDYTWDATSRLKQLKPVRFNWIDDDTNTLEDGFLAHEVSSVVPNAVRGEKDAVYTEEEASDDLHINAGDVKRQQLDHSKLVPLLVKTIQELEARIKTLEG